MTPQRVRFHLSTLLVLVFSSSVILFLNLREQRHDDQVFKDFPWQESVEFKAVTRGWPLPFQRWYEMTERPVSMPHEVAFSVPEDREFYAGELLKDIATALLLLAITGATAEYFARRTAEDRG